MDKKILINKYPFILYSEDNLFYLSNGNVMKAYKLQLAEIYSSSKEDFEFYQTIWNNAFRKLPSGTVVHIQDWYVKKKYNGSKLNGKHFIDKENSKHFNNREYIEHTCYLFYIKPDNIALNSNRMLNPFIKRINSENVKNNSKDIETFEHDVKLSVDYINSQKIFSAEYVTTEQLEYIESLYFNGMYDDLLTDTDLKTFTAGDRQIGIISIKDENQFDMYIGSSVTDKNFSNKNKGYTYHKGILDGIGLELKCNHIVNRIIKIKDKQQTKNQIRKRQKDIYGARGFSKQMEINSNKINESVEEIFNNDSLEFVDFHMNIIFWASFEKYSIIRDKVKGVFKDVDIIPYMPSGENKKNIFLNSFYPFSTNINYDNVVKNFLLDPASCLFSNITNYKDNEKGIVFQDRIYNTPLKLDVFFHSKAKNFGVVAPTGEGKSVACMHLMYNVIEHYKGVGIILDLGGSYRNLVRFFPKEDVAYISYETGKSFGVNNFSLESLEELTTDKINYLLKFIFIHWSINNPTATQSTCMRKIIQAYYENINIANASFTDFYNYIQNNKGLLYEKLDFTKDDLDISNMLLVLSGFFEDGAYSFLYKEMGKNINLTGKKLIVIELDKAKDDNILLSILMLMIVDIIERNILSNRSTLGVVLLDEFAKLLKISSLLDITEYYFQTMRKYEGSCGIVLQSPSQLPSVSDKGYNPAESIIENMQTLYVLYNKDGYDNIVDTFKLSEHNKKQLLSMNNHHFGTPPLYSEIGIKRGNNFNIYRLELPPSVLDAYNTDGVKYTRLNQLYKDNGGDMEKALRELQKEG